MEIFKNDNSPVIIKKNYKNHKDEVDLIKYSKVIVTEKKRWHK